MHGCSFVSAEMAEKACAHAQLIFGRQSRALLLQTALASPAQATGTTYYARLQSTQTLTLCRVSVGHKDHCSSRFTDRLSEATTSALQIHKQLSGHVGTKKSSHNEQHEQDKRAVEAYATELSAHLEDPEAPKPRFQIKSLNSSPQFEISWHFAPPPPPPPTLNGPTTATHVQKCVQLYNNTCW